jgi:DNA-binding transcriptional regulator GbsR (MarR family)
MNRKAISSAELVPTPGLSPITERLVLHWGEMGSRWGVNRTVAQIHALLYVLGRPVNADELVEMLGVARSNVSNSLKELQSWNLVRVAHLMGDRRDHFETSGDVWQLFHTVVSERKAREFDPTIAVLEELLKSEQMSSETPATRQRLRDMATLMKATSSWADEMLRLKPETLMTILRLGAKIQYLLRGTDPKKSTKKPST